MLNSSKGPAVQALRVQSDKIEYPKEMRKALEELEKLTLLEALVEEVLIEDNKAIGVILSDSTKIYAKAVILNSCPRNVLLFK